MTDEQERDSDSISPPEAAIAMADNEGGFGGGTDKVDVVSSTPEPQPQPQPPQQPQPQPHTKLSSTPPPRWRFVNEAKKKSGYSTSDAGQQVDGLSAEELAAKYQPPSIPSNSYQSRNSGDDVLKSVGKLSIPSFLQQQQEQELQKLQQESQRMKLEQDRLREEVRLAKEEKESLEKEARLAKEEKERVEKEAKFERESLVSRLAELENAANEAANNKNAASQDDNNDSNNHRKERDFLKQRLSELDINAAAAAAATTSATSASDTNISTTNREENENTTTDIQELEQKQTDIEALYASYIEKAEKIQRDIDAVVKKGEHDDLKELENSGLPINIGVPAAGDEDESSIAKAIKRGEAVANSGNNSNEEKAPAALDGYEDDSNDKRRYLYWGVFILVVIGACIGVVFAIVNKNSQDGDSSGTQQALRGSSPTIDGDDTEEPTVVPTMYPTSTQNSSAPSSPPTASTSAPSSSHTENPSSSSSSLPSPNIPPTSAPITFKPTPPPSFPPTSAPITFKPTTLPPTFPPTSAPFTFAPTSSNLVRITNTPTTATTTTEIVCPLGMTKFQLEITFGVNPKHISWMLLDACTRNVFAECQGCYDENANEGLLPDSNPHSIFQTCIPSVDRTNGLENGYEFHIFDTSGVDGACQDGCDEDGGSACGSYALLYGDAYESACIFFGVGSDTSSLETSLLIGSGKENCLEIGNEFLGEGDVTSIPITNPPTPTPTPAPVQQSIPLLDRDPELCSPDASVEYRLTEPRLLGVDFTNRNFGKSVAFVGAGENIVAASGGGGDYSVPRVHVYSKPPDSEYWDYLTTLDPVAGELSAANFSLSVGASKNGYIVIGAYLQDANESGRVYLYEPNENMTEWTQITRLYPWAVESGPIVYSPTFGYKVLMQDETIVVSSFGDSNERGSVYLFERTSRSGAWLPLTKLQPLDSDIGARFGSDISIYGNTLAVGAPMLGKVYIYTYDGGAWQLFSSLSPRDIAPGERFGEAIALGSFTLAATSPNFEELTGTLGTGTRIFNYDPGSNFWYQTQIIETDEKIVSGAGSCISMNDDTLLIGATTGNSTGITYQFNMVNGSWIQGRVIANPEPYTGDGFGCAVAMSGSTAVIGASTDSSIGEFSGSAYVIDLCPSIFVRN